MTRIAVDNDSARAIRPRPMGVPSVALCAAVLLAVLPGRYAVGQQAAPAMIRIVDTKRIASHADGYTEPSGLALARDGQHLWSVSDETGRIFLMDRGGKRDMARSIKLHLTDLEGIAADPASDRLLLIREKSSEIIEVWPGKDHAIRHDLAGMQGGEALADVFSRDPVHGLEGIAIDPDGNRVFLLKEKDPRLLLEVSETLDAVRNIVELSAELGFRSNLADDDTLDVSGLAHDAARNGLWIVSDTGRAVFFLDLTAMQATHFPMHNHKHFRNAEGIALVDDGGTLLIVTDDGKDSRLFTLKID